MTIENRLWWPSGLIRQQCSYKLAGEDPGLNPAQDDFRFMKKYWIKNVLSLCECNRRRNTNDRLAFLDTIKDNIQASAQVNAPSLSLAHYISTLVVLHLNYDFYSWVNKELQLKV